MDVFSAIFSAHESRDFTLTYVPHDGGSPSIGICMVKEGTAKMMGFKGSAKKLMEPEINAMFAALYLKSKQDFYREDWVKSVASYNAGTYNPSPDVLGCPRNLKYIKLVRAKLPPYLKHKLTCGGH